MKSIIVLSLPLALVAGAAQALEVTGGSVTLGYSQFTGREGSDVSQTGLAGALEIGLSQGFSLQADLGLGRGGYTKADNVSFALHAVGHASETTSIGGFVGMDRLEGETLQFYGLEVGHQVGQFGAEAFVSIAKDDFADGTVLGVKGEYQLSEFTAIGARYNTISVEGYDANRLSLTGAFSPTPSFGFTAEVGNAEIEDIGSELFVGVGMKINFGASRGATFDSRSVVGLLPGY